MAGLLASPGFSRLSSGIPYSLSGKEWPVSQAHLLNQVWDHLGWRCLESEGAATCCPYKGDGHQRKQLPCSVSSELGHLPLGLPKSPAAQHTCGSWMNYFSWPLGKSRKYSNKTRGSVVNLLLRKHDGVTSPPSLSPTPLLADSSPRWSLINSAQTVSLVPLKGTSSALETHRAAPAAVFRGLAVTEDMRVPVTVPQDGGI